jgi:hypothetical protein
MKKSFLIFTLFSLLIFVWAGSGLAYTINDNTLVREKTTNGGGWGNWKDVIGGPADFNIYGIDVTGSGGKITFDMYTNFDSEGSYDDGTVYVYLADLALDLNQDGTYEYGIVLKDHGDWTQGTAPTSGDLDVGLYSVTSWDTSAHFMEEYSGYIYGGKWDQADPKDPNVAIAGGSNVGNADVSFTDISGDNPSYLWSVSINASDLTISGAWDVFWGGTTCSNDAIGGSVPIPPSVLLLASGMIGLVALRRRDV